MINSHVPLSESPRLPAKTGCAARCLTSPTNTSLMYRSPTGVLITIMLRIVPTD
jgi:hypothetical protein